MKTVKFFTSIMLALLLALQIACASTSTQEGTGEYVDDSVITTKVKSALLTEPNLKSFEISVKTFKGTVQLSGFVSSEENVQKAIAVTSNVKGVKNVKNDMTVK